MCLTDRIRLVTFFLLTACLTSIAWAQPMTVDAMTRAPFDSDLRFAVPGLVLDVLVEPGMTVRKGEVLATLDDAALRLELELAKLESENNIEVRLAERKLALAQYDEEQASGDAKEKSRLLREIAESQLEKAKLMRTAAQLRLRQIQEQLEQHVLRAPVSGTVDRIWVSPGQKITPADPVIRFISRESLLTDVDVPTEKTEGIRQGDTVQVLLRSAPNQPPVVGKVLHVSAAIDPQTDTRHVHIHIPQPGHLLVGSYVTVQFDAQPKNTDSRQQEPQTPAQNSPPQPAIEAD